MAASEFTSVRGIVFDGDDTLWFTEQLYDKARAKARTVVERAGLDGGTWEALERSIDVTNVHAMGFSPDRFPTSCVQAYERLCHSAEKSPARAVAEKIHQAAAAVFLRKIQVVARARMTLKRLRGQGKRLALLTKGDPEVQRRRIAQSGLGDLFEVIEIVPEKTPAVIRALVAKLGLSECETCMVGNSVRSDILPAIEAGLQTVWIAAPVWEYERALDHSAPLSLTSLPRLADLTAVIA